MTRERSDVAALLARIAEALGETFEGDARLHAAVARLQRLGLSVAVHLELTAGKNPPAVIVDHETVSVPEWSVEDEDILRSLGIASESQPRRRTRASKPGRRQPR